ncbi:hypothetical protein F5141DRAFT_1172605 [Pisolithus sp. B1]|nr:hypothetical protein F5141DRAFT_1172605 [Pisolithus sp. B1]
MGRVLVSALTHLSKLSAHVISSTSDGASCAAVRPAQGPVPCCKHCILHGWLRDMEHDKFDSYVWHGLSGNYTSNSMNAIILRSIEQLLFALRRGRAAEGHTRNSTSEV